LGEPITQDGYGLMERAEEEHQARNLETAAALFGMAAEAFASDGIESMVAVALRNRAGIQFSTRDYAGSATTYQEAAAAADDRQLALDCRWGEADALARLGDWPAVLGICGDILPQIRDFDYEHLLAPTLLLQARAEYWTDDEEAALDTAAESAAAFSAAGDVAQHIWAQNFRLTVLLFLDRTAEAVALARDVHRASRSLAEPTAEPYHQQRLGEALLRNGQLAEAAAAFTAARDALRAAERPARSALAQAWLGRTYRVAGDDRAIECLREAVAALDAAGSRFAGERGAVQLELADALFAADRFGEAIDAYLAAPPGQRHAPSLERLVTALVREDRTAEVDAVVAGLDPQDPGAHAVVQAAQCWARWLAGDPAAGPVAEALLQAPELAETELAQAWVMEIVGRHRQSVPHLARAVSLYDSGLDIQRSVLVGRQVLALTEELLVGQSAL
jgi:tetratricopeptide (TPR) repeat protein